MMVFVWFYNVFYGLGPWMSPNHINSCGLGPCVSPNFINANGLGRWMSPGVLNSYALEPLDVTKSFKFITFGAIDVTKPYRMSGPPGLQVTRCLQASCNFATAQNNARYQKLALRLQVGTHPTAPETQGYQYKPCPKK